MREIKARAWFPKAKRMIHFEGISFCGEYDRMCLDIKESDCTEEYQHLAGKSYIPNEKGLSLWYTGLKDKNGKEIYEGDIVKTPHGNKRVFWEEYGWMPFLFCFTEEPEFLYSKDVKVIGNIYENPELLEK